MAKNEIERIRLEKFCESITKAFDDAYMSLKLEYDNEKEQVVVDEGVGIIDVHSSSVVGSVKEVFRALNRYLLNKDIF